MGGNFKFQGQDSDSEYFSLGDWDIWKTNCTFWKKATFRNVQEKLEKDFVLQNWSILSPKIRPGGDLNPGSRTIWVENNSGKSVVPLCRPILA